MSQAREQRHAGRLATRERLALLAHLSGVVQENEDILATYSAQRGRRRVAQLDPTLSPPATPTAASTAAPPAPPTIINLVSPTIAPFPRISPTKSRPATHASPPREYVCPITLNIMTSPVVTADVQTYERSAIQRWLSNHDKSPLTGTIVSKSLIKNHALRSIISEWKEKQVNAVVEKMQRSSESKSPSKQSLIHTPEQLKQLRCLIKLSSSGEIENGEDMIGTMIQSFITNTASVKQIMNFMHELSLTDWQVTSCALKRFSARRDAKASFVSSLANRTDFVNNGGINWIVRMMNVHGIKGPNETKQCLDAAYCLLQKGEKVEVSDLKVGFNIHALFKTGTSKKYPGRIVSINANNKTYEIKFNDGDVRSDTPLCDIFDSAKNQENFVAAGGVLSVVKIATLWESSDVNIAIKTCLIFNSLAYKKHIGMFSNCAKIGNAKGIQCIVNLMQLHMSDKDAVNAALIALWNLSCWNANKKLIIELGVVAILVKIMELHGHAHSEVARRCCGLLRNLSCYRDYNQRIIQEGGIGVIICTMEFHGTKKSCSELACRSLLVLAKGSGIRTFVELNGLPLLLGLKSTFVDCDALQRQVAQIITLVQADSNQSAPKPNGGICCAKTRNGTCCKNKTKNGKKFCWQHNK